ncbi:DNA glycosylase [Multifurca ochricompacta]|uniref:Adenine DNA glycosylase n=1 Tax=Multifurca ochricompacta TaxID=376703 RepID=A0AAD4M7M7_9AGAM|nr:DNA glycosylase [Multifurca ochricompacta]
MSDFDPSTSKKPQRKRSTTAYNKEATTDVHAETFDTYNIPHVLSQHLISSPDLMRSSLLDWYSSVHEARGMPWRKPFDPSLDADARAQRAYEVWISEIMLQQTQVATVIPYYNRWMNRFPAIKDLAASDMDTVNSLWKGLGYYSRAARLLTAAKKVVQELGGRLPDNAKDMEALIPGVGRYTAGAICSIAFNEQVPVLDGNVSRLASRLLAIHAPPKGKASLDLLWQGAQVMVQGATCAGDVNQALIELGSTVCKPRDPDCNSCPLQRWCRASQISERKVSLNRSDQPFSMMGIVIKVETKDIEDLCTICYPIPVLEGFDVPPVTAYPMKTERKKQREELNIVSVVEWRCQDDRWFLLTRRPDSGLLAGLQEFPTSPEVPVSISASEERETALTLLSCLIKSPCLDVRAVPDALRLIKIERAGDVLHVFSHIRKTYRVQWVVLEGGGASPPELAMRRAPAAPHVPNTKKRKLIVSSKSESMWLRLEEVEKANIGTGVLKVWLLARSLWEENGSVR